MDEGDYGQDYQARLNAEAIERHRRRNGNHPPAPSSTTGGGAKSPPLFKEGVGGGCLECSWCGEEIPEARMKAIPGCELCVDCQASKERLKERR